ncbi:uncharacterized protein LOC132048888 [Lycium ferocissimum]|uniref:uncharacterized protein LOC132048888 n=1 Tax=Lycium ferocissimum TaxID=112874 RepID=UPI0028163DA6|nr:uncharacterized protein LOC132048888 [Lycium ferocissimum]
MTAFNHFSDVSGLKANVDKISLYVVGVSNELRTGPLTAMQFQLGELPFKYLGVPLSSRKLNISQCLPLVDKIIARVKCCTSKFLSYGGRLQLIKSVLFEMQTYWAQVFLLPKKILYLITSVCRNFLRIGSNEYSKKSLVAWDTMCHPRSAGGLNIIDFSLWNRAAIFKLLWAVAKEKQQLQMKWGHAFYIKGKDLSQMPSPKQESWVVKKVFDARKWWNTNLN